MKTDVRPPVERYADRRHAGLTHVDPGQTPARGEGVVFDSRGVVLVVGEDASVVPHAAALAGTLRVVVCAPGAQDARGLPRGVTSLGGRIVSIKGRMGAFIAHAATSRDQSADIGRFSPNPDRTFDLVLDLSCRPHFAQSAPPLGYFAPGTQVDAIANAVGTLSSLVGRFSKPRYFEYTADLCAHGSQGLQGCARCIDVCSAAAIKSVGNVIEVDPYLCQGCATCTLACPTGALSFKAAPRADLISQVADTLRQAQAEGIAHPVLVVSADVQGGGGKAEPAARHLNVPALPAFGEEMWFAALAQGVAAVALADDSSMTDGARELLAERVQLARAVLQNIGASQDSIELTTTEELPRFVTAMASRPQSQARTSVPNPRSPKRALLLAAIDALSSGPATAAQSLPGGSPFGEVVVDRSKCTVCRACVNLCPTAALQGRAEPRPMLAFVEANCIQCGLCEIGCPEKAISLNPRFVADPVARGAARVLHEDDLACCVVCRTPFIAASLLASSIAHVKDFPGLISVEGIERLKMCPSCRQRESMHAHGG